MTPDGLDIQTRGREITFTARDLAPPSNVYIDRGDSLRIIVQSARGLGVVQVFLRILLPSGEVVPAAYDVTTPSDRLADVYDFALPEGFLLSAHAVSSPIDVSGRSTYVILGLVRGGTILGQRALQLCAGYVYSQYGVTWPGGIQESTLSGRGLIRSITGTDPAAGVEISETVPTGAVWRVMSLYTALVTDATVVDREPHLILDDGATVYYRAGFATAQAASQSRTYCWSDTGVSFVGVLGNRVGVLPSSIYMLPGHRVRTVTTGITAADNWDSPYLLVEEWLV